MTRGARAVPLVFVLVVWSLTTHGKFSDSGDEPHYLMVAESLVSDGDFDVANNYARGDGRWFGADHLAAGPHARVTRTGATWSTHDVGLPVLLVPVYAAATRAAAFVPEDVLARVRQTRGLFAYSLISLTFVLMTAGGLLLFLSAAARCGEPRLAVWTTMVLGLSPPVLSHAFLIFPETPAFFVVAAVLWLTTRREDECSPRAVLFVAAAVGLLPWLHRKYSFFVFGLAFVVWVAQRAWLRRQPRALLAGVACLIVVPQLALHLVTIHLWGTIGGPQMIDTVPFSGSSAVRGAFGLLFDRERGLIAYAPIYLLVPACWIWAGWRRRALLMPVALLFLPMATFAVWSAGFSPAARYLVPLAPLVAVPVVEALSNRAMRRAALPLLGFQAAVTATVWAFPRTLWPEEHGTNAALERIPVAGHAYASWLPSLLTGDPIGRAWMVLGTVAALTAALIVVARWNVVERDAR